MKFIKGQKGLKGIGKNIAPNLGVQGGGLFQSFNGLRPSPNTGNIQVKDFETDPNEVDFGNVYKYLGAKKTADIEKKKKLFDIDGIDVKELHVEDSKRFSKIMEARKNKMFNDLRKISPNLDVDDLFINNNNVEAQKALMDYKDDVINTFNIFKANNNTFTKHNIPQMQKIANEIGESAAYNTVGYGESQDFNRYGSLGKYRNANGDIDDEAIIKDVVDGKLFDNITSLKTIGGIPTVDVNARINRDFTEILNPDQIAKIEAIGADGSYSTTTKKALTDDKIISLASTASENFMKDATLKDKAILDAVGTMRENLGLSKEIFNMDNLQQNFPLLQQLGTAKEFPNMDNNQINQLSRYFNINNGQINAVIKDEKEKGNILNEDEARKLIIKHKAAHAYYTLAAKTSLYEGQNAEFDNSGNLVPTKQANYYYLVNTNNGIQPAKIKSSYEMVDGKPKLILTQNTVTGEFTDGNGKVIKDDKEKESKLKSLGFDTNGNPLLDQNGQPIKKIASRDKPLPLDDIDDSQMVLNKSLDDALTNRGREDIFLRMIAQAKTKVSVGEDATVHLRNNINVNNSNRNSNSNGGGFDEVLEGRSEWEKMNRYFSQFAAGEKSSSIDELMKAYDFSINKGTGKTGMPIPLLTTLTGLTIGGHEGSKNSIVTLNGTPTILNALDNFMKDDKKLSRSISSHNLYNFDTGKSIMGGDEEKTITDALLKNDGGVTKQGVGVFVNKADKSIITSDKMTKEHQKNNMIEVLSKDKRAHQLSYIDKQKFLLAAGVNSADLRGLGDENLSNKINELSEKDITKAIDKLYNDELGNTNQNTTSLLQKLNVMSILAKYDINFGVKLTKGSKEYYMKWQGTDMGSVSHADLEQDKQHKDEDRSIGLVTNNPNGVSTDPNKR